MKDVFRRIKAEVEVLGISSVFAQVKYVIVGFSGGADSSLLLEYFVSRRNTETDFPEVRAVHVNHMLRGAESDSDEEFCRRRCAELSVPLEVRRIDVPAMMAESGMGCEECARKARYAAFDDVRRSLDGDSLIATAHNADDNLETVLFNLARGGGATGLSGIAPVREDGVVRPLLGFGAEEIRQACRDLSIPFVTDSTNAHEEYTRNFIRHSVVPRLKEVNPAAADASVRAGISLREDGEFIRGLALDAVGGYLAAGEIPRNIMAELPDPVLARAIVMLTGSITHIAMSAEQVRACRRLIRESGTGKMSLPDGVTLEVSKNLVSVFRPRTVSEFCFDVDLPAGDDCVKYSCEVAGFDLYFCRNLSGLPKDCENIYKLSINSAVRFDTIYGKVYVRSRMPGDSLYLGGTHRKLKKMICDRGVPESRRARLPVICDCEGVLLVPGLPVRGPAYARPEDHSENNVLYVLYCLKRDF